MTAYAADLERISDSVRQLEDLIRLSPPTPDAIREEEARRFCMEMRGQDGAIDNLLDEIERLLPAVFSFVWHADYPGGIEGLRTRLVDELLVAVRAQLDWLRRRWRVA
jgi:hypothetical protein